MKSAQFFLISCIVYCLNVDAQPCPFNADCDCNQENYDTCNNCSTFPTFYDYDGPISTLIVSGNYSTIPKHSLYPLTGLSLTHDSGVSLTFKSQEPNEPLLIEDDAFTTTSTLYFFSIEYFKICRISTNLKSVSSQFITLWNNLISSIDDFAFCSCNVVGGCSNRNLLVLDLRYNLIANISENAFSNLNSLVRLSLSTNNLTAIPTSALSKVAATLNFFDISSNQISYIMANSFYNFISLTQLSIDFNPITHIEPGAFNGMSSLTELSLANLPNISSIDILISYGMQNLQQLSLENCASLKNITLSDYTKLPPSLTSIAVWYNDVREVSSDFQYWLSLGSDKAMDISDNRNFICQDSIAWMAKFVICTHQIITIGTQCNGTSLSLYNYLESFQPTC